ncbi:50S ribosomal protein L35 [Patescibacteria group bacterium]|nr:50S ribosomal protein L35 [Patescibacteria group bacterium]
MSKQKTNKAARKRFQISATGKVRRRKTKQSHFNAKASGDATRKKHASTSVHHTDRKRVEKLLPYS